jgi:hypothetical protein
MLHVGLEHMEVSQVSDVSDVSDVGDVSDGGPLMLSRLCKYGTCKEHSMDTCRACPSVPSQ